MSIEASFASGLIGDSFTSYAKQLDDINERRERLVKASRDVTIASKKVIFAVHR
jgi:predicted translin family RNA/ssDNA-binding protein